MLFIIGDWNAKVESQEIPEITGKFGLGIQNEAGQRLTELCQENALVIATPSSNNTREDSTHRFHKMVNTKIRLYFLQLKMEKLYTVSKNKTKQNKKQNQKQTNKQTNKNWELTVAQIMNSLLQNSGLN